MSERQDGAAGVRAGVRALPWRRVLPPAAAVALVVAALWVLRSPTPGGTSEAALLLAMGGHGGAGPLAPAYRAVAGVLRWLPGDFVALQLVGVLGAAVAVLATALLVGRLSGSRAAAWLAGAVLACWPGLAASAPSATAAGLAVGSVALAALALARSGDAARPWLLGGAAVGLAVSCDLLLALALAPALVWVGERAAGSRRLRELGLGAAAACGTAAALWAVGLLLPGGGATGAAVPDPSAAGGTWLVAGAGGAVTAAVVLSAAALGAAAWVLCGRWRVAVAAATGTVLYGAVAALTRPASEAVAGSLPAAVGLAVLAGGLALPARRIVRIAGLAALAVWATAGWVAAWPALSARRSPAPAWQAAQWVVEHYDRGRTTVVAGPGFEPFADLVLRPRGFRLTDEATALAELQAGGQGRQFLMLAPLAERHGEVVFAARWRAGSVQRLLAPVLPGAVVTRYAAEDGASYSAEWQMGDVDWVVLRTATVTLDAAAVPRQVAVQVRRGEVELRRAGGWRRRLAAGDGAVVPLWPGPAGGLAVTALGSGEATLAPAQAAPLQLAAVRDELADAVVVPQAASTSGHNNAYWRTDLTVCNPQAAELPLESVFLPSDRANDEAPAVRGALPAGRCVQLADVLQSPGFKGHGRVGALVVRVAPGASCRGDACGFALLARTYNANAGGSDALSEGLPGVPARRGIRVGGWAEFDGVDQNAAHRASVGVASWSPGPVTVRIVARGADGSEVARATETVPPWGHRQLRVPGKVSGGTVRLEVAGGPPDALVFPYVSVVDQAKNVPEHRLPGRTGGPAGPRDELPPMPRPARAAAGAGTGRG